MCMSDWHLLSVTTHSVTYLFGTIRKAFTMVASAGYLNPNSLVKKHPNKCPLLMFHIAIKGVPRLTPAYFPLQLSINDNWQAV